MDEVRWNENALLTVREMGEADRLAGGRIAGGSFELMRRAGREAAYVLGQVYSRGEGFDVLCGPGNNGGDGYVVASLLAASGRDVALYALGPPKSEDAKRAAQECGVQARLIGAFQPAARRVAVDALFGAGLTQPLDDAAVACWRKVKAAGAAVAAIDLPSGLDGDSGRPNGESFEAAITITFARRKPAHLLYPGRALCGRVFLRDIGIDDTVVAEVGVRAAVNRASLWKDAMPWPEQDTHKYKRGHLAVCSGPAQATGAARLSARAGARAGAGAVTILSPPDALADNAAHLTATMLRKADSVSELLGFLERGRAGALVLGPGFGALDKARELALAALAHGGETPLRLVLDADGISAFREEPGALFQAASGPVRAILTPHEGEFARLFPDLAEDTTLSKIDRCRQAARRSNCVVILKGADTVVAEPAGRAVVNDNATPFLATAGSGDVLAGLCGGLLAQGMPIFDAACAAVWIHAEAGRRFGAGLTADDLPDALLPVLRDLAPSDLQ